MLEPFSFSAVLFNTLNCSISTHLFIYFSKFSLRFAAFSIVVDTVHCPSCVLFVCFAHTQRPIYTWMLLCIHVYLYASMCVFKYMYSCVCVFMFILCIAMCLYLWVFLWVCMCVCMCLHVCLCIFMCVRLSPFVCIIKCGCLWVFGDNVTSSLMYGRLSLCILVWRMLVHIFSVFMWFCLHLRVRVCACSFLSILLKYLSIYISIFWHCYSFNFIYLYTYTWAGQNNRETLKFQADIF